MYHVAVEARQRIWIRLHPKTLALGASGYSTGNLAGFWLPYRIVDLSVVNPECFFLDSGYNFLSPEFGSKSYPCYVLFNPNPWGIHGIGP